VILHLIRHAHAVAADENPLRPLSVRGRTQVAQLAAFFRTNGQLRPAEVWHSPLVRARETAALLAAALGWAGPLLQKPGLEPGDDPRATAARLAGAIESLAIVGHEPHLSALATFLVRGPAGAPILTLKKGACLALEQDAGRWYICWLVGPALLSDLL
jgi:phosphohistidine phosphatase